MKKKTECPIEYKQTILLINKNKLCSLTCGGCFTRILRRDSIRKKVLRPCQDLSKIGTDFAYVYKTLFGVGSLDIWGSNPEESLDTLPRPVIAFPITLPHLPHPWHDHIRRLRYVLKRRRRTTTTTTTTLTQPIT